MEFPRGTGIEHHVAEICELRVNSLAPEEAGSVRGRISRFDPLVDRLVRLGASSRTAMLAGLAWGFAMVPDRG